MLASERIDLILLTTDIRSSWSIMELERLIPSTSCVLGLYVFSWISFVVTRTHLQERNVKLRGARVMGSLARRPDVGPTESDLSFISVIVLGDLRILKFKFSYSLWGCSHLKVNSSLSLVSSLRAVTMFGDTMQCLLASVSIMISFVTLGNCPTFFWASIFIL